MAEKTCTELVVRHVGSLQRSPNGHPYVECSVDGGLVAVWGSPGNMSHINTVRAADPPFEMVCDCVPSRWDKHDLWVYEKHEIYRIRSLDQMAVEPAAQSAAVEQVSLGELSEWRRRIAGWVRTLESGRSVEANGLGGRIGALSRSGAIPRDVAALMRAVTEMRNAAEYDSKALSKVESLAVRHAWLATLEWATRTGLSGRG